MLFGWGILFAQMPTSDPNRTEAVPASTLQIPTIAKTAPRSTSSYALLDTLLPAILDGYDIVGLTATIHQNGAEVWTGCFGFADNSIQVPITDSTLFVLCSISKSFTGTALMQLWEQGLFELDDPINNYLPFDIIHPHYPDSLITFHQLLTFTSAIRDNWNVIDGLTVPGDIQQSLQEFLQEYFTPTGNYYNVFQNFSYFTYPGERFLYSNLNYVLIAYLVEILSGVPFADYCEEFIFDPLALDRTRWFLADIDTTMLAHGHNAARTPLPHFGTPIWPAGGLRSNPPDMWRFMSAIMNWGEMDGVRLLDSTTVDLMLQPRVSMVPYLWHDYGYAFHVESLIFEVDTMQVWGHSGGWENRYVTYMFWCKETETACVAMINSYNQSAMLEIYQLMLSVAWTEWLSVKEPELLHPDQFLLERVYPNPFNPEIRVRYRITDSTEITISVCNLLGQHVLRVNKGVHPPGSHEECLQMPAATSGVYIVLVETPMTSAAARIIHLK